MRIRKLMIILALALPLSAQQPQQQPQEMRVPKKPFIDIGLRWETVNGDKASSKSILTLTGPDGKQLYSGAIGKVPQIPFDADKMPAGTYTVTLQVPESDDHPAANWKWSFAHLAVDSRSAENYSILVVFDASGRHGQVSFLAVERF